MRSGDQFSKSLGLANECLLTSNQENTCIQILTWRMDSKESSVWNICQETEISLETQWRKPVAESPCLRRSFFSTVYFLILFYIILLLLWLFSTHTIDKGFYQPIRMYRPDVINIQQSFHLCSSVMECHSGKTIYNLFFRTFIYVARKCLICSLFFNIQFSLFFSHVTRHEWNSERMSFTNIC